MPQPGQQRMISPVVLYDQDQPISPELSRVGYTTLEGRYNLCAASCLYNQPLGFDHLGARFAEGGGDTALGGHGQDRRRGCRKGAALRRGFLSVYGLLPLFGFRLCGGGGFCCRLRLGLVASVLLRSCRFPLGSFTQSLGTGGCLRGPTRFLGSPLPFTLRLGGELFDELAKARGFLDRGAGSCFGLLLRASGLAENLLPPLDQAGQTLLFIGQDRCALPQGFSFALRFRAGGDMALLELAVAPGAFLQSRHSAAQQARSPQGIHRVPGGHQRRFRWQQAQPLESRKA